MGISYYMFFFCVCCADVLWYRLNYCVHFIHINVSVCVWWRYLLANIISDDVRSQYTHTHTHDVSCFMYLFIVQQDSEYLCVCVFVSNGKCHTQQKAPLFPNALYAREWEYYMLEIYLGWSLSFNKAFVG